MANTLTVLAPTLFSVADEVAAEACGALDAVNMNFSNKGVAVNDTVTIPIAPVAALGDYTAAMTTTAGSNKTATSVTLTLTNNKETSWHLTGEEQRTLENGGDNAVEWARQLVGQGMRTIRNAMAAAACVAIKQGASRATGTAGTTPFASDLSDITNVRKILRDNGAPMSDLQLVVTTDAYLKLLNQGIIQQASLAGTDAERRDGILRKQFGFMIREDSNIAVHTPGAPSGTLASATEAIGETSIAYDGDANGPWAAGDIVTLGSGGGAGTADANKYVVAAASTATPLLINSPGLRVAHEDNDTMTIGAAYTGCFAFERGAVVGIARPPLIPANVNIKQIPITDKFGLTYLLCEIVGDGMVTWRLNLAYVFKTIQSEFVATILG